ncbi:hypothetical protein ACLOJK_025298 [Asimina triloba]
MKTSPDTGLCTYKREREENAANHNRAHGTNIYSSSHIESQHILPPPPSPLQTISTATALCESKWALLQTLYAEVGRGEETAVVASDDRGEKESKGEDGEEEVQKEAGPEEEAEEVEEAAQKEVTISRLRPASLVPPIQIQTPSPAQTRTLSSQPPIQTPQELPYVASMNSRAYTNRISSLIFIFHMIVAAAAVGFLIFKAVEGMLSRGTMQRKEKKVLKFWLPQIEGSVIISIVLAWAWQKAFRQWPAFMVRFILWSSFALSLSSGILLLCFSMAATDGVGVALIGFAVGNGLYSCWVTPRIGFAAKVISKSLEPVAKFRDLNQPTYWMLGIGFVWMSLWTVAVIGSLNFHFPPLIIIGLILSLMWLTEVMRNVVNVTVSRVISLYYLRGMQMNTQFCFQRAMTRSFGSSCLGSVFVPAIEALRIVARVLNLLRGEDEFMFSCAHCCLKVMEAIFRCGNGWAFVHIGAYGRDFVRASKSTWELFERQKMEALVDSDITSSVCFLTGTASGSVCVIFAASWTFAEHRSHTATVSMLAFFIGYLLVNDAAFSELGLKHLLCDLAKATPYLCLNLVQESKAFIGCNSVVVVDLKFVGLIASLIARFYVPRIGGPAWMKPIAAGCNSVVVVDLKFAGLIASLIARFYVPIIGGPTWMKPIGVGISQWNLQALELGSCGPGSSFFRHTRISMALPHACVSCYYVCYAENPRNRLFDDTIPNRLHQIETGRDIIMTTPRFPRRGPLDVEPNPQEGGMGSEETRRAEEKG